MDYMVGITKILEEILEKKIDDTIIKVIESNIVIKKLSKNMILNYLGEKECLYRSIKRFNASGNSI